MSEKKLDYPLLEIEETALRIIQQGGHIYQKWTCQGCNERKTNNTMDSLAVQCKCEECGAVTDITVTGCNYVAMMPMNTFMDVFEGKTPRPSRGKGN